MTEEEVLHTLLEYLSKNGRQVVIRRYGLFGYERKTYSAIGEIMEMPRERVSQIQRKAMRTLRQPEYKDLVESLTHKELREAILREEK